MDAHSASRLCSSVVVAEATAMLRFAPRFGRRLGKTGLHLSISRNHGGMGPAFGNPGIKTFGMMLLEASGKMQFAQAPMGSALVDNDCQRKVTLWHTCEK